MPAIYDVKSAAIACLEQLMLMDQEYQRSGFSDVAILNACIEYVFLNGYKCWENFIEDLFISYSVYNPPISGITPNPYLNPLTETRALKLLKLEKPFMDWTSPDTIISRAEICFENHTIISEPLKRSIQDIRDAKRIRNCVAHGSKEAARIFNELCRSKLGITGITPGVYLNKTSPDRINNFNVYYLNLFKLLVEEMT